MTTNKISRRDTLKVLGSMGAATLVSGFTDSRSFLPVDKTATDKPNILIILFDALAARHMSLYGYGRQTTPNIDQFARRSTIFHRHYSVSNFTQPSTASILTGVHPWSHRSLDFFESLLDRYEKENIFDWLAPAYQTIAYTHNQHVLNILEQFGPEIKLLKPLEDLALYRTDSLDNFFKRDKNVGGYATKTWLEEFFSPSLSLFLSPFFDTVTNALSNKVRSDNEKLYPLGVSELEGCLFKIEDAMDWIVEISGASQSPFFGYFHLLPPHEEYKPRVEFLNMFAEDQYPLITKPEHFFSQHFTLENLKFQCQRYDEYVAHVDAEFGRLVENLEEQGTLNNSYLILTSDHGQLFERGIHGHIEPVLYESVIHTPLLIHGPGQTENINIYSPTSSLDLVPSILQLAGSAISPNLEGHVLPTLGGKEDQQRMIFSMYARQNSKRAPLTTVTLAAIQWPYKLIKYQGYKGLLDYDELFDLEKDPEELTNLAQEKPLIVTALNEELHKNLARAEEQSLKS